MKSAHTGGQRHHPYKRTGHNREASTARELEEPKRDRKAQGEEPVRKIRISLVAGNQSDKSNEMRNFQDTKDALRESRYRSENSQKTSRQAK